MEIRIETAAREYIRAKSSERIIFIDMVERPGGV